MRSLLLTALAALSLAACDASAPAPQAAAPAPATTEVTPDNFRMPSGEGCAGDIARYRAIMDNDLSMGHVAKSVYDQIEKEITEKMHNLLKVRPAITWLKPRTLERALKKTQFLEKNY